MEHVPKKRGIGEVADFYKNKIKSHEGRKLVAYIGKCICRLRISMLSKLGKGREKCLFSKHDFY